jgi:hypothetical protein
MNRVIGGEVYLIWGGGVGQFLWSAIAEEKIGVGMVMG